MDTIAADLSAFLGRGAEFTGIDNEGIDFSQLEDFINSDGNNTQNFTFGDSLTTTPSGKLLNVIVENKRNNNGHSLPDSPPDSSSEHPYSPQDGCEAPLNTPESIYTNLSGLGQNIYKQGILNPILTNNLILGSHIVVTDQNSEGLIDSNGIIQDNRLLVTQDVRNANLLGNRILTDGISSDHEIILSDNVQDPNRQILLPTVQTEPNSNYSRSLYEPQKDFVEDKHIVHLGFTSGIESLPRSSNLDSAINNVENNIENIPSVYTNLQNVPKKRKLSQDSALVKSEPEHCTSSQLSPSEQFAASIDEEYASSEACLSESQYQCIRFSAFQQANWHTLCDQNLTELSIPHYRVDADKGFNFSNADDAFVCQKKNHFQITCHVQLLGDAQFVKTPDGFQKISSFHIHFYGVKHDCPTQTIRVEQSQSDRSKKPFHPVLVELVNSQVTKITVGRLHFSETTSNNMRKKGKPNPEQRYFQLVVGLHAHTSNGNFPIVSHASQKIIVRASNPGQFESDVELCWQKGQTQDSVFHNGKVGINTDRPDESLVVHGNIKITGHIIQPSDIRAKKNIVELNTAKQLKNIQMLRVVSYEYEPTLASQLRRDKEFSDTGVIAQEVAQVLPEAVKPAGNIVLENGKSIDNFLVVNKERIFMENIGAVKELCKVTDNLETRIGQLERINRRLNKLKRGDSLKSDSTVNSSKLSHYSGHCKCSRKHICKACERQEDEFCSNKFIQIVIVVLVLIMAFCLAAITTLYFLDAKQQRPPYGNVNDFKSKTVSTTTKSTLEYKSSISPRLITSSYQKNSILAGDNEMSDNTQFNPMKSQLYSIGKSSECNAVDQHLENLCPIHCCPNHVSSFDRTQGVYTQKEQPNSQTENQISNYLDRTIRTKRSTDDNTYDPSIQSSYNIPQDERESFVITIQGKNFNSTLTPNYRIQTKELFNYSYKVPISKYMPDEFLNITFSFHTPVGIQCCSKNSKEIEFTKSRYVWSAKYEVYMADCREQTLIYRVVGGANAENLCEATDERIRNDLVEIIIDFYRNCSE
ncbi:myelin regulatory factor isoform X2 [Sitophilus oryzae]|uniref:Myelin regulatory factor n=1 Tax=Sitophilus oryzae TaxID=7048 RepID=A0A6J2XD56_SITOR|nr:myelin regulatory factor isoform X2 [Sitophilus oryzae]